MIGRQFLKPVLFFMFLSQPSIAQKIPDAYETVPGKAQALNGTATAYGIGDLGALSTNPALLFATPNYEFSTAYHWPTAGREFYQAGIIDSKTRKIAAALSYTGYMDKYNNTVESIETDSKLTRRIQTGFAHPFGKISFGVSLQYLEAKKIVQKNEIQDIKGFNFGLGLFTKFSKSLSLGASANSLNSKKLGEVAPKTYRAGLSYKLAAKWLANLDLKQRDRTPEEVGLTKPERMGFVALIYNHQNKLELLASYGKEFSTENGRKPRESLSGGASIQMEKVKLGYTVLKPYRRSPEKHQSIHLSFAVRM